jgi:hypothetical protein
MAGRTPDISRQGSLGKTDFPVDPVTSDFTSDRNRSSYFGYFLNLPYYFTPVTSVNVFESLTIYLIYVWGAGIPKKATEVTEVTKSLQS